jgi:seryl-tRNA synthetase
MISELEEGKKLLLDERTEMMQQIATLEGNMEEANEKQTGLQNQLSAVTAAKQTTEEELVRLQDSASRTVKVTVFWDVISCSLVKVCHSAASYLQGKSGKIELVFLSNMLPPCLE